MQVVHNSICLGKFGATLASNGTFPEAHMSDPVGILAVKKLGRFGDARTKTLNGLPEPDDKSERHEIANMLTFACSTFHVAQQVLC